MSSRLGMRAPSCCLSGWLVLAGRHTRIIQGVPDMQDLVSQFATAEIPSEQLQALRGLAQAKALQQSSKSELFTEGLRRLAKAAESPLADHRVTALVALGRIWSAVKPLRPTVEQFISAGHISEPAQSLTLDLADDREYLAQAIRHIRAPWVARYAAVAAVTEEAGESARTAYIDTLLGAAGGLRESVKLLTSRLSALSFATGRPADSMARRVRRILFSLHSALGSRSVLGTDGAGSELAALISDSFRRVGPPASESLRKEIVGVAAQVMHDIIRTRFSQATDPSTYNALDVLKRWFRPHEWEDVATESAALQAIAADASEAIMLLAKAGVTDDRMRVSLALTVGSERAAGALLARLSENLTGVRPDIRHWLSGTVPHVELPLVTESAARNLDQVIADVLVRRDQIDRVVEHATQGDIEVLFRLVVSSFRELARIRALELTHTLGETVDYSPSDHEMVGGARLGIRRVVVLEPQVRARQSDGSYRVVRKALVRPEGLE